MTYSALQPGSKVLRDTSLQEETTTLKDYTSPHPTKQIEDSDAVHLSSSTDSSPSFPHASALSAGLTDTSLLHLDTLIKLRSAIEAFDKCALRETAIHTVFSDGDPKADLMLVGEAPGADEDAQGLPFVGRSGQLLNRILEAIQLKREEAYISNIVPWRPPGNRVPTPQEIDMCLPFIARHISLVTPKILVLLGGTASKGLLQTKSSVGSLRSRWHIWHDPYNDQDIPTLVTFHPAYLLRSPDKKKEAWGDWRMVKKRLQSAN
jgi:DNA polymerase